MFVLAPRLPRAPPACLAQAASAPRTLPCPLPWHPVHRAWAPGGARARRRALAGFTHRDSQPAPPTATVRVTACGLIMGPGGAAGGPAAGGSPLPLALAPLQGS
eukprot:1682726-Rhodomonas_salina.1